MEWSSVHLERSKDFGGAWFGLEVARLLGPSSELRLAETVYDRTAMSDRLGIPAEKVNDDRLYRALDAVLPHKAVLEKRLLDRMGSLFGGEAICFCTISPRLNSKTRPIGTLQRNGVVRVTTDPTASRCASVWW